MNWLNIFTPVLRSPEFIGSEPVARATWLYALAYCAEQENGGCIVGAREWKDRQWQQTCGVTLAEIESAVPALMEWDGQNLIVRAYPNDAEKRLQNRREAGRIGGQKKTEAKTQANRENGAKGGRPAKTHGKPTENPNNPSETQVIDDLFGTFTEKNGAKPKQNPSKNPTKGEGEGEGEGKGEGEWEDLPTQDPSRPAKPARGVTEGKNSDRIPTTPQSIRFAKIMNRRLTTAWTEDEVAAYRKLGTIPDEDLAAVERHYAQNRNKEGAFCRTSMLTLLRHFHGEVDKAKAFRAQNGKHEVKGSVY